MTERPSGTLTLLHSDIENSTSLTRQLRDRYPEVLARHQSLLRSAFTSHEGVEVDTQGDSFFAVFVRATQAVAASAELQRALAAEPWREGSEVRVRVGLHTGEPILTGTGYTGLDVVRAARIKEAGHGGQVLLSASTAAIVEDALVEGLSLRDLGPHRLKSLPRPERVFELLITGLSGEFPPLKTLDSPGGRARTGPERIVTAVLFSDMVGGTERVVEVGDRRWHELLVKHRTAVRAELARHGGYELGTAGDGFLATFDVPTQAVRCACAIQESAKPLGISLRVGIHAGEVEREGNEIFGITLFIGSRISSLAQSGEVLVSSAVRDMAAGSGIAFVDRGTHVLRGVPGEWRLFAPSRD